MIDPEFKAKWVAALRSGKYKQGIGTLNSRDKFCCLGVACDLLKEELETDWKRESDFSSLEMLGCSIALPKLMKDRIKLQDREEEQLIEMNDSGQGSFDSIADYIEKEL